MTSKSAQPSDKPQPTSKNAPAESDSRLKPVLIDGQIGSQLRQVYSQLLSEPLPDKFSQLLQQLAKPSEPEQEI